MGALLMQTVESGLVQINADPYVYPLVTSAVIFCAVLVVVLPARILAQLARRRIRPD